MKRIDQSPTAATLNYLKGQILTRLKLRGHNSGSTALELKGSRFLDYARQVVTDYLDYGAAGDINRIRQANLLEIGPGDNLSVALLLLAKGAATVTCIDAFTPKSDSQENREIYRQLFSGLSDEERSNLERSVSITDDGSLHFHNDNLTALYKCPAEQLRSRVNSGRFDIILSRAVLEHVERPYEAWQEMTASLAGNGEMWHKVDFRSHNYYNAIHPLYFLTIPSWIWRLVSSPDPTLNRERLTFYREISADTFGDVSIYVTHILESQEFVPHIPFENVNSVIQDGDVEVLRKIRPHLPPSLERLPTNELLVNGIFIICRDKLS